MKDEKRGESSLFLSAFYDRDKNPNQFVRFDEHIERVLSDVRFGFCQYFQPVRGFVEFLKCQLYLADELCIGAGTTGFTVMSAD